MYSIYWIHLNDHTDVMTEGYIGMTCDLDRRMREHRQGANYLNTHLAKAIRMYGWDNLQVTVLDQHHSKDYAFALEAECRKEANIGWNIAKGGDTPIGHLNGRTGKTANRTEFPAWLVSFVQSMPSRGRSKTATGMTYKELAELTGLTLNNVRNIKNPADNCYRPDVYNMPGLNRHNAALVWSQLHNNK